jgi:hypothetical protein
MASSFMIGTTSSTTSLDALTTPVPDPKSSYLPYARINNKGNGGTRGIGSPVAQWTFPVLELAEYSQLKTFCPGASADVYIQTKLDDDTFELFQGKMIWPNEPQDRWYGERKNFTVIFRNLILIPEGS